HGARPPPVLRFVPRDPSGRRETPGCGSPRPGRDRRRRPQEGEDLQPRDEEATRPRPIPSARSRVAHHGRAGERPRSAGDALLPRPDPIPQRERQDGRPGRRPSQGTEGVGTLLGGFVLRPHERRTRMKAPAFLRGLVPVGWHEFYVNLRSVRMLIMIIVLALIMVGGAYGIGRGSS